MSPLWSLDIEMLHVNHITGISFPQVCIFTHFFCFVLELQYLHLTVVKQLVLETSEKGSFTVG